MIRLREILSEDSGYTDEEKKQLGIPLNAVSKGGRWYVDDIYAGKVVDGKFVKAKYEEPIDMGDDTTALTPIEDTEIEDYPTLRDARKLPNVRLGVGPSSPTIDTNWSIGYDTIADRMAEMGYTEQTVDETSPEALSDRELIEFDYNVEAAIESWQERSVWRRPVREREELFVTVNDFIDENNTTVSENLYRGLHFATNSRHDKTFIKTILNKMAVGNEIPLPPSGFTAHRNIALQFANIGSPVISVIFTIPGKSKPVKGVRIWGNSDYPDEREVLTKGGNYKILSVVMQEFDDYLERGQNLNVICLMIELEQAESLNETKINDDDSKLFAILFGDNMRNTAKNLKHLRKK
jgi:hypothetical protein